MQKLQLWLLRLAEPGRKPAREYRPSFERLWWEAGPAVLSALDNTGDRIPQNIGMRLRNWTEQAISSDPVAALELGALDQPGSRRIRSAICTTWSSAIRAAPISIG